MRGRRKTGLHARWAWLLVAAVLLLRAAVPQGFMPERTETGTLALAICGSGGVIHIPLGDEAPPKGDAPSHCAFAGVGGPADLPTLLVLPEPVWNGELFAEQRAAAQRVARLHPRPPSRAPPASA